MRGVTTSVASWFTYLEFQLTRLMRGVTHSLTDSTWTFTFQLTRLMRGVTNQNPAERQKDYISTHTPHARRDYLLFVFPFPFVHFNSHASCEAWPYLIDQDKSILRFQLTRLMRGVTSIRTGLLIHSIISTHTPHARRDNSIITVILNVHNFNSHASCEAWLDKLYTWLYNIKISTHTPHARRDIKGWFSIKFSIISTHTPHARRDHSFSHLPLQSKISTHTPHARRDYVQEYEKNKNKISTHTPHARRDCPALL